MRGFVVDDEDGGGDVSVETLTHVGDSVEGHVGDSVEGYVDVHMGDGDTPLGAFCTKGITLLPRRA